MCFNMRNVNGQRRGHIELMLVWLDVDMDTWTLCLYDIKLLNGRGHCWICKLVVHTVFIFYLKHTLQMHTYTHCTYTSILHTYIHKHTLVHKPVLYSLVDAHLHTYTCAHMHIHKHIGHGCFIIDNVMMRILGRDASSWNITVDIDMDTRSWCFIHHGRSE